MRRFLVPLLIAVVIGLWGGFAFLPSAFGWFETPQQVTKAAAWGEVFGSLTALFTALGFVGIIWTLKSQQDQSAEASRIQQRARFEGHYFQLIGLLRQTRDAVKFKYSEVYGERHEAKRSLRTGTAAFRAAWIEAAFWIDEEEPHNPEHLGTIYETHLHRRYESNLAPYFRLLHTIMKRIKDENSISDEEKAAYGNLLRSQLNSFEVALAALNGLAPFSGELAMLLTEFHMLKYLPEGQRRQTFVRFYPPDAFAGRDKSLLRASLRGKFSSE